MDRSTSRSSERERRAETASLVQRHGARATGKIGSSALLVRLAARLGKPVEQLALELDEDVVRRTKYPCIEDVQPDGSIIYRQPTQVIEGSRTR
jgi:hypothetical protein